jgi:hypothetical protein
MVKTDDENNRDQRICKLTSDTIASDHFVNSYLSDNVVLRTLSSVTSSLTHRGLYNQIDVTVNIPPDRVNRVLAGVQTEHK